MNTRMIILTLKHQNAIIFGHLHNLRSNSSTTAMYMLKDASKGYIYDCYVVLKQYLPSLRKVLNTMPTLVLSSK